MKIILFLVATINIAFASISLDANATDTAKLSLELSAARNEMYLFFSLFALAWGGYLYYDSRKYRKLLLDIDMQHKNNTYEMEKIKLTNDFMQKYTSGEIGKKYRELKEMLFDFGMKGAYWNPEMNVKKVCENIASWASIEAKNGTTNVNFRGNAITMDQYLYHAQKGVEDIELVTYELLNFFESMAASINSELANENMLYNFYCLMAMDLHRWAQPLLNEDDKSGVPPFGEFVALAIEWEKELRKHTERLDKELEELSEQKEKLEKMFTDKIDDVSKKKGNGLKPVTAITKF